MKKLPVSRISAVAVEILLPFFEKICDHKYVNINEKRSTYLKQKKRVHDFGELKKLR